MIKAVGWGNLKVDGFNFINWYHDFLGEFIESIGFDGFGVDEDLSFWCWMGGLGGVVVGAGLDESDTSVLLSAGLLVMVLMLRFNSRLSRDLEG